MQLKLSEIYIFYNFMRVLALRGMVGAGEGNRTLIASLEGWSFTTKLHPRSLNSSLKTLF